MTLSDLERLAMEATPGPRSAEPFYRAGDDETKPGHRWRIFLRGADNPRTNSRDCDWTERDARFIAAMDRERCLALLRVVRAAVALEKADIANADLAPGTPIDEFIDALAALNLKDET